MSGVSTYLQDLREVNSINDEGIYHYEHQAEAPYEIQKYWCQRYDIFSKYDDGIWMTNDAWFGITPEPVAKKIAEHLTHIAPPEKTILIDAFGGAGGNAIAFALSNRWKQVFYIEKDPHTTKCAKHNAEIYGVKKKIVFTTGDCFKVIPDRFAGQADKIVIFASPPWGGPNYKDDSVFDLSAMEPYNLEKLHSSLSKMTPDVALYLPRTSNLNQLAKYGTHLEELQVMHYCLNGASKALCAYYGRFLQLKESRQK